MTILPETTMLDLSPALAAGSERIVAARVLPLSITFGDPEPVYGTVPGLGRCVVGTRLKGLFPAVPPRITTRLIEKARAALHHAGYPAGQASIRLEFVYPDFWLSARRRGTPSALTIEATMPCEPVRVAKPRRVA